MLAIKDLQVSYGGVKALHGISVEVNKGEFVAMIGNNGAGKTTTLSALCGLVRSNGGTIQVDGQDITKLTSDKIASKGIALVPEGRRVFTGMSVQENLDMGAFLRRNKQEVQQDMEKVYDLFPKLKERRRQQAGTLSGGEQQMLAIGRALMSKPSYLLLDEPSLGLAPVIVERIFETIAQINKEGISILMVEQNVPLSLSVATRAYVLETGNIVMQGSAKELLQNEMVQQVYLGLAD